MNHQGEVIAKRSQKDLTGQLRAREVIDCINCGYPHLNPLPSNEELGQFYAYHFYEKQKPDYLSKMESEEKYWIAIYKMKIELFFRELQEKNPRVLDVGSSGGLFLFAAQSLGARVLGIEPSEKAAAYAIERFGIETLCKSYEQTNIPNESFDVIHSSLVMEHLIDPKHYLEWCLSKLRPHGILVCETPNEFNRLQRIVTSHLNHEDWFVAHPDHLNYFNEKSLRSVGEKFGFKFLKSYASFPMEAAILSGYDYLSDGKIGSHVHLARMKFELNLIESGNSDLLEAFYKFFADHKIGRTITCVFTKPN
ncbi:class I SAM-dependent methyltransferase [bacterium]|nr:class I SAM-dependent methyltransferase [bacterium]